MIYKLPVLWILIGGGILVFLIDFITPAGFPDWALYYVLMIIAAWNIGPPALIGVILLYAALMSMGPFISHPDTTADFTFLNRVTGVLLLFVIAYFINQHRKTYFRLQEVNSRLDIKNSRLKDAFKSLSQTIERIDHAFFAFDKNMNFLLVNSQGRKLIRELNPAAGDPVGKNAWVVLPLLKNTVMEEKAKAVMQQQVPVHFDYKGVYSGRDYAISGYPSADGLTVYMRDITEEKLKNYQLIRAHSELNNILNSISDAFFAVDYSYNLIYYNDPAIRLGFRDAAPGKNLFDVFPSSSSEEYRRRMDNVLKTGKPDTYETFNEGRWLRVNLYPSEAGLSIFILDFTSEKNALEAMQKANERLKETTDRISDIFFACDNEWKPVYWNEAAEKLAGVKTFAPKKTIWEIFPSLANTDYEFKSREAKEKQEPVSFEKEGFGRYFHINIYPSQEGVSVFAQDITDRVMFERNLENLIHEKTFLIKETYHRIKNNLQIVNSVFNLQLQSSKDPAVQGVLSETISRIHNIALLHSQLYQGENFNEVSCGEYMRSIIDSLRKSYRGEINISYEIDEVQVNVHAAIYIGLIVNEIISNSMKYGEKDGEVNVRVKVSAGDEYLTIEIRDMGRGFGSSTESERSTGLGMQLINVFTEQLEGEMECFNDNGAVVRLRFRKDSVEGLNG